MKRREFMVGAAAGAVAGAAVTYAVTSGGSGSVQPGTPDAPGESAGLVTEPTTPSPPTSRATSCTAGDVDMSTSA